MQIIIDRFLRSEKSRLLKLKPIDKLLLFFLASYMGNKNDCFPSYRTLMLDLGINDKTTLSLSLKRLESLNLIKIKKTKGKGHHFSFMLENIAVGNPYDPCRENPTTPVGNPYTNNINNNITNNKRVSHFKKPKSSASTFYPEAYDQLYQSKYNRSTSASPLLLLYQKTKGT